MKETGATHDRGTGTCTVRVFLQYSLNKFQCILPKANDDIDIWNLRSSSTILEFQVARDIFIFCEIEEYIQNCCVKSGAFYYLTPLIFYDQTITILQIAMQASRNIACIVFWISSVLVSM
jgi:hypothetical protein